MTNLPPDPQSSSTNSLGFDDFIGILVSFLTIGTILFWAISRRDGVNVVPLLPLLDRQQNNQVEPNSSINLNRSQSDLNQSRPRSVRTTSPNRVNSDTRLIPFLIPDANFNQQPGIGIPGLNSQSTQPTTLFPIENPLVSSVDDDKNLVASDEKEPMTTANKTLPTIIPPPINFRDVSSDFWANRFINTLSSRGIIKGFPDYTFRPTQPVNRAEFASIIEKGFNTSLGNTELGFTDLRPNFWANPAIKEAINAGFLRGYPDNTFQPSQRIPRVQVLVALVSGLKLKTPASPEKFLNNYKDANQIPDYAREKIAAATENGLVVNYPNTDVLNPNQDATRAEVTAMVYQALVRTGRLEAISSKYIATSSPSSTPLSPSPTASPKVSPIASPTVSPTASPTASP